MPSSPSNAEEALDLVTTTPITAITISQENYSIKQSDQEKYSKEGDLVPR